MLLLISNKILSKFRIRHIFKGMTEIRNNMYSKPERAAVIFKNKKSKLCLEGPVRLRLSFAEYSCSQKCSYNDDVRRVF